LVLVQSEYLPTRRLSRKLDDKWRGPFLIVVKKGSSAYELELPQSWKGHNVFNMSRLKRFVMPAFGSQPQIGTRPDPVITNEGREEYEVQEILDKRGNGRKTEYLVRWKDYGPEDDTWEASENLKNAPGAVQQFKSRG
jgi:hypothetical protein